MTYASYLIKPFFLLGLSIIFSSGNAQQIYDAGADHYECYGSMKCCKEFSDLTFEHYKYVEEYNVNNIGTVYIYKVSFNRYIIMIYHGDSFRRMYFNVSYFEQRALGSACSRNSFHGVKDWYTTVPDKICSATSHIKLSNLLDY